MAYAGASLKRTEHDHPVEPEKKRHAGIKEIVTDTHSQETQVCIENSYLKYNLKLT